MASFSGFIRRLRGDHIAALVGQTSALSAEVAAIRSTVLDINHTVVQIEEALNQLNHDVRFGAERSLPLFLGYAERLRLDADTAIGATQVIERQLALLENRLDAADETVTGVAGPGSTEK